MMVISSLGQVMILMDDKTVMSKQSSRSGAGHHLVRNGA